jgi:hypothetical protein
VKTLLSLALVVAAPLAAPSGEASLAVRLVPGAVEFSVDGPSTPFVATVLLSLSPDLVHYFTGLPPLLADHVVTRIGFVEQGSHFLSIPDTLLPPGVMIQAQGVTFDGVVVGASAVESFVLDATGEG